jgi:hypothetical protein
MEIEQTRLNRIALSQSAELPLDDLETLFGLADFEACDVLDCFAFLAAALLDFALFA